MGRTWGATEREAFYYEEDISEVIERANQLAYERAYKAQCERELALWNKRRNSDSGITPS